MSHRIGIIGFSTQKFDVLKAQLKLFELLKLRGEQYGAEHCCVISGLTNLGVPAIAYQCAVTLKMKTVGIACSKAKEYECFPCDEVYLIGEEWGDESPAFLSNIDELIKVGGGKQSEEEFKSYYGPKSEILL